MARLTYARDVDAAFLHVGNAGHRYGRGVSCFWEGERGGGHVEIILDPDGYVVGVEFLQASKRLRRQDLDAAEGPAHPDDGHK